MRCLLFSLFVLCSIGTLLAASKDKTVKVTFEDNNKLALIEGSADDVIHVFDTFIEHTMPEGWETDPAFEQSREHREKAKAYITKNKLFRIHIGNPDNRDAFETAMNEWHSKRGQRIWITNPAPVLRPKKADE